VIADPSANRVLTRRVIAHAVDSGADVVILSELMTTGYHLTPAEAEDLSEAADGPSIDSWIRTLAGSDTVVIGGFCESGPDGRPYNSAAMVSSDGVLAVYRKTHLWAEEPRIFTAGSVRPPVVHTRWGSIGMAVCYDLFFPELTRGLALEGAFLLAVPTNSPYDGPRIPRVTTPADGIGHSLARTTAYVNRVFVAVCDRHGDERGTSWKARSSIVGPEGQFLAGPVGYAEELLIADCDLPSAARKRWDGTDNDAFADRRPELYGVVTAKPPAE
jgi:predicted amidohydrolase